jgi:hypothetical protein
MNKTILNSNLRLNTLNKEIIYIFEIILENKKDNKIIRRIKNNIQGNLLSSIDNIKYNDYEKIKIIILNCDSPKKPIIINGNIDRYHNKIMNGEILIEINNKNYLECNYYINI